MIVPHKMVIIGRDTILSSSVWFFSMIQLV